MVTIKDIAKRAGVSVPTVSRVLNHRPNVADELVARINVAIAEMNYRPSRTAQRLRTQDSRLVGVILSDFSNPFYINVLKGIEQVLSQEGMSVLVSNADSDAGREAKLIDIVRGEAASGLIIAPTHEASPVIKLAVEDRFPVVVFDRRMRDVEVDTVFSDSLDGAYEAVRHLIALGNTRVAIISGPVHLSSARDRYAGYMQAISDGGLPVDANLVRFGDYRQSSGYELAQKLIELPDPPTAIFVANNSMTIGALNAIHEAGRTIPDDIAVVGFDDFDWAISLNPPLTTVAQSPLEIGTSAANLLLARIADRTRPARTLTLHAALKVRASCGATLTTRLGQPSASRTQSRNDTRKE